MAQLGFKGTGIARNQSRDQQGRVLPDYRVTLRLRKTGLHGAGLAQPWGSRQLFGALARPFSGEKTRLFLLFAGQGTFFVT